MTKTISRPRDTFLTWSAEVSLSTVICLKAAPLSGLAPEPSLQLSGVRPRPLHLVSSSAEVGCNGRESA